MFRDRLATGLGAKFNGSESCRESRDRFRTLLNRAPDSRTLFTRQSIA